MNSVTEGFWRFCHEIQQMSIFPSTAVPLFIRGTRLQHLLDFNIRFLLDRKPEHCDAIELSCLTTATDKYLCRNYVKTHYASGTRGRFEKLSNNVQRFTRDTALTRSALIIQSLTVGNFCSGYLMRSSTYSNKLWAKHLQKINFSFKFLGLLW